MEFGVFPTFGLRGYYIDYFEIFWLRENLIFREAVNNKSGSSKGTIRA